MPFGWTKITTPAELHEVIGDPDEFEKRARRFVADACAKDAQIFWEHRGGPAYILTTVDEDKADEVFGELEKNIGKTTRLKTKDELT